MSCTCGHMQAEHDHKVLTSNPAQWEPGRCHVSGCDCRRYDQSPRQVPEVRFSDAQIDAVAKAITEVDDKSSQLPPPYREMAVAALRAATD